MLDVSSFSEYEVIEGPYCGDSECQSDIDEACDICVADCGTCPDDGNNGNVGRRGSNPSPYCQPDWECNWGPCVNNYK